MPHYCKIISRKNPGAKQLLTDKIVEAVLETINTEETSISVAVEEIHGNVKEKVYSLILFERNTLTKTGYTMD